MGLKELKQELIKQDKETLVRHLLELYKKYDSVKEYYDFYINPKENELLERYKEKVREGFYPKRGMRLKISLSRKAINDFRKYELPPELLGDLLLYYVECGADFINDYGDINESYYDSAVNTLEKSMKIFMNAGVLEKYKDRVSKLVEITCDVGYGFGDMVEQIFIDYYDI